MEVGVANTGTGKTEAYMFPAIVHSTYQVRKEHWNID